MDEMDSDRDGFVDFSEFAAFHYGPPPHGADGDKDQEAALEAKLQEAFQMYDANSNGKISARELDRVLRQLSEKCSIADCSRMIHSVSDCSRMVAQAWLTGGGVVFPALPCVVLCRQQHHHHRRH
ncbi:hypothetical protein E2562_029598 [Oryza meyeriana var. granulata]|uniref:EF-hand domain-containing protein n=1 Tax=Oryza meyeriana var. granulata TaxID=110450 RepID=A0A6G1E699_9ORYZ|nr:hypothetical protein E2562_029598 [Oryza meyeriana var. granulata]